jgi:hypothetical protein
MACNVAHFNQSRHLDRHISRRLAGVQNVSPRTGVCMQAGPPFATYFGTYGTSERACDARSKRGSIKFGTVQYSDILQCT